MFGQIRRVFSTEERRRRAKQLLAEFDELDRGSLRDRLAAWAVPDDAAIKALAASVRAEIDETIARNELLRAAWKLESRIREYNKRRDELIASTSQWVCWLIPPATDIPPDVKDTITDVLNSLFLPKWSASFAAETVEIENRLARLEAVFNPSRLVAKLPPYLAFQIQLYDELGTDRINAVKKEALEDEIWRHWPTEQFGPPSKNLIAPMATFLRSLEAKRGGAKRQQRSLGTDGQLRKR